MTEATTTGSPAPIPEEFMITRQGKQFVLYAGLLDAAHKRGLRSIKTELLKLGMEDGEPVYAVMKALVLMDDETQFEGIGDATLKNVSKNIAPHLIRMAETRAKARALRDAINVGATALEETSGDESDATGATNHRASAQHTSPEVLPKPPTNGHSKPPPILTSQIMRIEKLSYELWGDKRAVEEKILKGVKLEDLTAELAAKCITGLMKAQDKKKKGEEAQPDQQEGAGGEEKSSAGPAMLHVLRTLADELYANREERLSGSEWLQREIGKPFSECSPDEIEDLIHQVEEEGISEGVWSK